MKGVTLASFLVVALLLAGCGDLLGTARQLATVAPTAAPLTTAQIENSLVQLYNRSLQESVDPLSATVEGRYNVDEVSLLSGLNMNAATLSVEVHCECIRNVDCCTVEHTFILVIQVMKARPDKFLQLVPPTISTFQVSCFDHVKFTGSISFPWQPIQDYLMDRINGYQLGGQINKQLSQP